MQVAAASRPALANVRSTTSALSTDTSTSLNTEYHGPVIPPNQNGNHRNRTLVLCFDGTGDQFDMDNSNVVQFFSVLKKGDRSRQLVYYQSGIGTYSIPQVATPFYSNTYKLLDLLFATHLNHHVMSGYKFLMQNYREGDKICIFGFSRGAYTARALAGMVHKVGLLPAWNEQQVSFAYKMYSNDNELGWKQSVAFKRAFSIDVDIEFVGVWDTVASVGLLPRTLPFTKSNTAIKVFRHALSLDEHRVKFKPSLHERITADEARRGDFSPPPTRRTSPLVTRGRKRSKETTQVRQVEEVKETKEDRNGAVNETVTKTASKVTTSDSESRRSGSGSRPRAILGSIKRSARGVQESIQDVVERVSLERERSKEKNEDLSPDSERDQLEQMYLDRSRPTDALEVWFSGCHCDVGGGSVSNNTPSSLARISLRWMIRECFLARTGIQFEADKLIDLGLDPMTLYPRVLRRPQDPVPPPLPPKDLIQKNADGGKAKQESSKRAMESPSDGKPVRVSEKAVEGVKTGNADASAEAPNKSHRRPNGISLDGTLVEYDGGEDAPDVKIEAASVIDLSEKTPSHAGDDHNALHGMPTLGPNTGGATHPPHAPAMSATTSTASMFMAFEAGAEERDAHSPVYDQLKLAKWWWLLEYLPIRERVQRADGTWKKKWRINRGRARVVPQDEPLKVHRSVKMRMDAKDLKYAPRVKFAKEPVWVD
ncbi:hypothetical protein DFH11DRAFT_1687160 [Phellopilus nigrolimitatus]|nr:hypothetical protein DFH11DRAFT_1687160 [Phellopilus nigrolimitatus]